MAQVHPTAVVEKGARLADDVAIGPLCHVGPEAVLGPGTRLVSQATILGRTILGDANTVWPQATLGADPQDLKFHGEATELVIGSRNDIRESVTIHRGTGNGGGATRIGSDNLIMAGAHVAHDCTVGDHVTVTNLVLLAGHVEVGDHAVIGGGSAVGSYVSIGPYAFVAGMTRVTKDVPPFMTVEGNPAIVRGVNTIGLQRNRFSDDDIDRIKHAFRSLFRDGQDRAAGLSARLDALEGDQGTQPRVRLLIESIRRSIHGHGGRHRETQRRDDRRRNPAR